MDLQHHLLRGRVFLQQFSHCFSLEQMMIHEQVGLDRLEMEEEPVVEPGVELEEAMLFHQEEILFPNFFLVHLHSKVDDHPRRSALSHLHLLQCLLNPPYYNENLKP